MPKEIGSRNLPVEKPDAGARTARLRLRILQTTDLHMQVHSHDYYSDRPDPAVGLGRTATLVQRCRAEVPNCLLFDNGDFLQGNPVADFLAAPGNRAQGTVHPFLRAMNRMAYDAGTLGNHDFDYGLDYLKDSLAGASHPVVSANVFLGGNPNGAKATPLLAPFVLLRRKVSDTAGISHELKIGVVGFLPPDTTTWNRDQLAGRVHCQDIVAAAQAVVPQMRRAGADLVVALCHSGIGPARHRPGMENAAVPLARVEGIDVVLAGHRHQVFPSDAFKGRPELDCAHGLIHGKPAVMAGARGSHLGVIDVELAPTDAGWRIERSRSHALPIARMSPDGTVRPLVAPAPEILDAFDGAHQAGLIHVRQPVGTITAPVHSYFSLVADDPSLQLVARSQSWFLHTALQGTAHQGLPILSAAAPFRAGGFGGAENYSFVPPGEVSLNYIAALYLYPNMLRAVRITGAELREWLERAAGQFRHITPGASDQPLLEPGFPSYNFDVIDGVTYEIDLGQPSRYDPEDGTLIHPGAHRIRDLRWQGAPVRGDQEFVIATNSFRAAGGGNFPGHDGSNIVFSTSQTNRDILMRYLAARGRIDPSTRSIWRFAPMPGTSVVFDSSPRAGAYVRDVASARITPAGKGPDGFARFRIRL